MITQVVKDLSDLVFGGAREGDDEGQDRFDTGEDFRNRGAARIDIREGSESVGQEKLGKSLGVGFYVSDGFAEDESAVFEQVEFERTEIGGDGVESTFLIDNVVDAKVFFKLA